MWSLGCMLYAHLSGHLPFVGSFAPQLQAKIAKEKWKIPGRLRRARERRTAAASAMAYGCCLLRANTQVNTPAGRLIETLPCDPTRNIMALGCTHAEEGSRRSPLPPRHKLPFARPGTISTGTSGGIVPAPPTPSKEITISSSGC
ncbi:unnamed protein product [Tilletia controversa]|nr:unnamed protein product [Tilletia controversa]CAD6916115.1 unnamed protein product [Tilletia controversa]CAD6973998.1 unnamed protein product [Tilletia controversa]